MGAASSDDSSLVVTVSEERSRVRMASPAARRLSTQSPTGTLLTRLCSSLSRIKPSIDDNGLRGEKRVGNEQLDGIRNFFWSAKPPNGNARGKLPMFFFTSWQGCPALNQRRCNCIDRHPVR